MHVSDSLRLVNYAREKGRALARKVGALPTVCVAVYCSVLQCIAVCCSVLQCVAVCWLGKVGLCLQSVLLCVCCRVCCSVLQCVAVCCSVLQCVAVCCSVLQCAGSKVDLIDINAM